MPPTQVRAPENHIELIPLAVRQQVPDFGSHRFKLRTGCRIEEIAILVNDVLYYTLPSIAALEFPEPEQWKKSWETIYRSLMPHRRSIIEDEQRVKPISEFPFSPPPHGVPGPWTDQVVREISNYFQISPKSLPQQLIVQLGICEDRWPYIRRTTRTYHHLSPDKKNARRTSLGSSSRLCRADCCRISIAHSTDGGEGPDTGNLIGVGLAAAVTTGDLLAALTTQFPRPTAAPPLQSTRRQSRPRRRVDHRVSHITVDRTPAAKGPQ